MNYQIIAGVRASVLSVFPFFSYYWNKRKDESASSFGRTVMNLQSNIIVAVTIKTSRRRRK